MPEVLTAPVVVTGDQALTDGAVVVGDTTVEWVGPTLEVPARYAAAKQTHYFGSTIMIVDIHDATPGKAVALIHAHDYMVVWGGPTRRAVAALKKCPVKPAPGP